jgi:branched-subunit amino acid permease
MDSEYPVLILEEYFAVACLISLIGLVMIVDEYWGHWISDLDRSQKEAVFREVSLGAGCR